MRNILETKEEKKILNNSKCFQLEHDALRSLPQGSSHVVLKGYGLSIERQRNIPVFFRGHVIGDFKADLIVEGSVIIELKAVRALDPAHEAQLINYLKATNVEVGLLLNFGRKPDFKRFIFNNKR